jgi:hypothetical protein
MLAAGREGVVAFRGMCCLCCSSCAWCAPRAHVRKPYVCMHLYHRISSLFTNAATVCDCGAGGGDEGAEELEELSRKGTAYFDAKSTKYQVRMSGMYSSHMLVSYDHIAMSDSATTA